MGEICYGCFSQIAKKGVCPHCGFDPKENAIKFPNALKPGTVLNERYILGRVLGQGGFGITYAAQDFVTNQRVAIKEYMPEMLASRDSTGTVTSYAGERSVHFEQGKDGFLNEANALVDLRGNSHIVNIYDFFESNGTAYFVMEFVQGTSLKAYIKMMGGNLGQEEANRILLPIMDALADVHSKGLIHRDIAPDNIIVTAEGAAKLIDFGAARYSTGEKSLSLDVVLKHGYAPKEQYTRRGRQGAFTDVYAMAATYYYAVTGRTPPESVDRLSEDELIPPTTLGAKLDANTENALLKALEVQPADRYQSMNAFVRAIKGEAPEAAPKSAAKASSANSRSKALLDRAAAYLQDGKWDEAEKCCNTVLIDEPENADAKLYKRMAQLEISAEHSEAVPAPNGSKNSPSSTATRKSKVPLVITLAAALLIAIAAGIYAFASGMFSAPKAEQTVPEEIAPPAEDSANSGEPPAPSSAPAPSTESVSVSGQWGYSSLTVDVLDERRLHFELTDARLPDGYVNSPTPGKNDPWWGIVLMFDSWDSVQISLQGDAATPLEDMTTYLILSENYDYAPGTDSFEYKIEDKTLIFDITLPDVVEKTCYDIGVIRVNHGTDEPGYSEGYEIPCDFPDPREAALAMGEYIKADPQPAPGELGVVEYRLSPGLEISNPSCYIEDDLTWIEFSLENNDDVYFMGLCSWSKNDFSEQDIENCKMTVTYWQAHIGDSLERRMTTGMPNIPKEECYVLFFGLGKDGMICEQAVLHLGIVQ